MVVTKPIIVGELPQSKMLTIERVANMDVPHRQEYTFGKPRGNQCGVLEVERR